ncbi:hypothetical protein MtrunA17_Chr3g0122011 [Medicago truncatula]|uniref:Uncharacterized protein n=1 Tax=Medicago truncatula TaxID=3880 RepID=A0A396IX46_MEDTR|nr:hypothetical protein MtrunA17_Chr3g0122011 [Medicago truncatula]
MGLLVHESCPCWQSIQTPSFKKMSSCLSLIIVQLLSKRVRLDVFLSGDQVSTRIPNLPSSSSSRLSSFFKN